MTALNATTIELQASVRSKTGKGIARKIRKTGLVPATIYRGGQTPNLITINPKELSLAFHRTMNRNTLVNISLEDGNTKLCLVKEVQRHPVSGSIRHVDFYNVDLNEKITISVPVSTVGKAAGTVLGGKLRVIRRDLDLQCKPNDIPFSIKVDVTELEEDQFIRASQISAPANCELVFAADFNVVTVVRKRGSTAS